MAWYWWTHTTVRAAPAREQFHRIPDAERRVSLLTRAVINKWPKCAVHFAAGDLAAAREALVNEVLGYAAYRGTSLAPSLRESAASATSALCGVRAER